MSSEGWLLGWLAMLVHTVLEASKSSTFLLFVVLPCTVVERLLIYVNVYIQHHCRRRVSGVVKV